MRAHRPPTHLPGRELNAVNEPPHWGGIAGHPGLPLRVVRSRPPYRRRSRRCSLHRKCHASTASSRALSECLKLRVQSGESRRFNRSCIAAAKAMKIKEKDGGRDRDRTGDPLLAKRKTRLQRLILFSLTVNVHNKSGNVLFVQRQPESVEKDRFAHSRDTAFLQDRGPRFFIKQFFPKTLSSRPPNSEYRQNP